MQSSTWLLTRVNIALIDETLCSARSQGTMCICLDFQGYRLCLCTIALELGLDGCGMVSWHDRPIHWSERWKQSRDEG